MRPLTRALIAFAAVGGVVALAVTWSGSLLAGVVSGLLTWAIGFAVIALSARGEDAPDAGRRRFLATAGAASLAWVAGGTALGRVLSRVGRPDARLAQREMARGLGAEYMELVRRQYHPRRSGDLQLLLAPFNSSNYANESVSLVPNDPRTSHASVWMYLERVPIVAYAPGRIQPGSSVERVTLADLAPTTASLMGFDRWPGDRDGRPLSMRVQQDPGDESPWRPAVVVTFVIDGGGWNVLEHWNGRWPNLKRLMREGMLYRNAITGSFPAVTACAHATIGTGSFPATHGITGHNIRDGHAPRKAYREPGAADPSDILVPTLADLWSDVTENRAWVGEIGYQVWHLGMLGYGGRSRPPHAKPVGVFWDELAGGGWAPHHPDLYRVPAGAPPLTVYDEHVAAFSPPPWDAQFTPRGRQTACCSPPITQYQGDLIASTFASEPIGRTGTTDLLYVNFKSPDYTGHIYNMLSEWEGLMLEAVDTELGRLVNLLDDRFPGRYVLLVTADHGQCPTPETVQGVRLDPIQLGSAIERRFGGLYDVVQSVVPHEVYLDLDNLRDAGAGVEDVAAFLRDYTYRENIGPYVPQSAIEQDLLDRREFSGVFAKPFLDGLTEADLSTFGSTSFTDPGVDPGMPPASLYD